MLRIYDILLQRNFVSSLLYAVFHSQVLLATLTDLHLSGRDGLKESRSSTYTTHLPDLEAKVGWDQQTPRQPSKTGPGESRQECQV